MNVYEDRKHFMLTFSNLREDALCELQVFVFHACAMPGNFVRLCAVHKFVQHGCHISEKGVM